MSLLGRLEDLSLTDIIQIVYLSRRTGVLEIIDSRGRHTVLFRQGLVVNASAPAHPDLVTFLEASEQIPPGNGKMLRKMEEGGIPYGTAALELNLLTVEALAEAVRLRILAVVTPLLQSREGEFNFILSESMNALDVEYETEMLFKDGGFAPNRIVGAADGEKIKPLKGLEDSLKAGKALLRGASTEAATPSLNLGLGQTPAPAPRPVALAIVPPSDNVVLFPAREEADTARTPDAPAFNAVDELPDPETPPAASTDAGRSEPGEAAPIKPTTGQFKVAGGLFEVESPDAVFRNVVLFERNALVRVAARRAFARHNVKIFQYGSLDDVRSSMTELFRSNSFFVTFLELTPDDATVRLLQQLKRKNPRLPVVVIDEHPDLRRRHDLLRAGADLYLTKPSPERMQPGLVEEELSLFADELVLFADRAFQQWEQLTGGGFEAGRKFYEQASKETVDRSFGLLKQLINELSNPNDISQVTATILRLSAEYLDRAVLFAASGERLTALGGFGTAGDGGTVESRVRDYSVARDAPSILAEAAASGEVRRGKMRRTPTNVELVERMGGLLPTEVVAVPIMQGGRAVGILYGDNAEHRVPIDSTSGLEIFLSQAGYAFGNAVFASERAGRP